VSAALQTVHVRVNDATSGKPTPVRIRFSDDHGQYFAPLGRLTRFALSLENDVGGNLLLRGKEYAYIDGTCEIRLPPGPFHVEIHKGPEYEPVDTDLHLVPGKLALRFEIRRHADSRTEGWYAGDTHCYWLSPRAALLEGAAEGLAVVNVMAEHLGSAIPNILEFSGQAPALQGNDCLVVVGTRNTHPTLGDLLLLNAHRIVFPLTFGGPDGLDDWTLADWCSQCHRKGGLVIGDELLVAGEPKRGEILAEVILGAVDALQLTPSEIDASLPLSALDEWTKLLNAGFRFPLVAGSGKASNTVVLGDMRTYAHLRPGEPFTYKSWIEAIRAGRTCISNGPLLFFTVNGKEPGEPLHLGHGDEPLYCRLEVRGPAVCHLEILANGRKVLAGDSPLLEGTIPAEQGGWLAARCWVRSENVGKTAPDAQTSAVSVHVAGRSPPCPPEVLSDFRGHLAKMLNWIDAHGRFQNPAQRERLRSIFEAAREVLAGR
jgi:hypothetical protein